MTNIKTQKPSEEVQENEDINNGKDKDKFCDVKGKQIAQMLELMDNIRDNQ